MTEETYLGDYAKLIKKLFPAKRPTRRLRETQVATLAIPAPVPATPPKARIQKIVARAHTRKPVASRRRRLNSQKRDRIFAETSGTCYYCGAIASCIDHVIPRSFGGTDDDFNLIASCTRCNELVSSMIFDDLEAKKAYILQKTATDPSEPIAHCIDCGQAYRPNWNGSTRFLCSSCNAPIESHIR